MRILCVGLILLCAVSIGARGVDDLKATGHDSRIDLVWEPASDAKGYNIYRSENVRDAYVKLNDKPHATHVYSDFIGENDKTFLYSVKEVGADNKESAGIASVVSATSRAMTDDELLTSVQEATFRYFWDYGHPVSGLSRERNHDGDRCTIGGSGFGLMVIMVGVDRGFVTREQGAERIVKMLKFVDEKADTFHGAWSHWLNGATGAAINFSKNDDAADLVETSYFVEGALTVRQYFDGDNATERELRRVATKLWEGVEWDWFLQTPDSKKLTWHWSPNFGWEKNLKIGGRFNECMITYLLASASPTHPIPTDCYMKGWASSPKYANGQSYFGIQQPVGRPMGGPLFFTHYTFISFDPREWSDPFCNYFENNTAISRIHHEYAKANPEGHKGYSELVWGLTSSDGPDGYRGNAPDRDTGTIAPTAALSAMPYTPKESMVTLKHYYHGLGDRLWGEFGFHDSFNLGRDWFAKSYLAIDQGPIVCMIENHRSGLCWEMFMRNPEIEPMLKAIGFKKTDGK